ncbi:hypothetical protein BDV12DRAFT_46296 [Aspergillus spectabilis]
MRCGCQIAIYRRPPPTGSNTQILPPLLRSTFATMLSATLIKPIGKLSSTTSSTYRDCRYPAQQVGVAELPVHRPLARRRSYTRPSDMCDRYNKPSFASMIALGLTP